MEPESPGEEGGMEVDQGRERQPGILANPARFEALIRCCSGSGFFTYSFLLRFGRGLQQLSVQLEQEKGRNEVNTTLLQVLGCYSTPELLT